MRPEQLGLLTLLILSTSCYRAHEATADIDGGIDEDASGMVLPPVARTCRPGEPCDCRAVQMVPAGVHWQGYSERGTNRTAYHHPGHRVELTRDRWLATYETTAACYHWCRWEAACEEPRWRAPPPPCPTCDFSPMYQGLPRDYWSRPEHANLPILDLTLDGAREYCRWLGGRLPTEVEWEKAARGEGGRRWPWRPDPPSPPAAGMRPLGSFSEFCSRIHSPYTHGIIGCRRIETLVVEVDFFPGGVGPYGHFNLSGNVVEWVADAALRYPVEEGELRVEPPPASEEGALATYRGRATASPFARTWVAPVPHQDDWNAFGVRCAFDEQPSPLIFMEDR